MSFFKSKKTVLLTLVLIIAVGFFLRFYKLNTIPNGPEWDEASVGYNAFSIAKTGHDEWGNKLPLIFPAFGDYKNPLYIYLTAIVVRFAGLNIFTTRFVNTLSGSLFVLIWYFIAKSITKNERTSFLTAYFAALSPFGIFFSRIAGDGIMLSVFLISLGVMFELFYLDKKKPMLFFLSILTLLLSIFSYNLARVISPILIFLIFILNLKISKNKKIYIPILIISFLFFLVFLKQLNISLKSRLQYVGILGSDKGVVIQINELRQQDNNSLVSKITHNKLTLSAVTLANNYVTYFSSQFLLGFNDNHLVFESQYPPLFTLMLPFYYFGIVIFVKELFEKSGSNDKTIRALLLALLFIAPLPAVIVEGVSGKRSLATLGIMQFLTAYGLIYFFDHLKKVSWKRISAFVFTLLIIVNIVQYIIFYFNVFPQQYGIYFASRENRFCEFVKNNYQKYDYFIYSRQVDAFSYIFPLFCLSFPSDRYTQTRTYTVNNGWYSINSFDKFIFPDSINTSFINNLIDKKNKRIAIFLDESENDTTIFNSKNMMKTRLPIPSQPNDELYLYSLKIL